MKLSRKCLLPILAIGLSMAALSCIEREKGVRWHDVSKSHKEKPAAKEIPATSQPTSQPVMLDKRAVAVPKPPFTKGIFPCSECHEPDDEVDTKKHKLTEEHVEIKLEHGPREGWCFECHNPKNRDKLHLASGRLVSFETSYLLCGQCHGPKLRDWRAGAHGKRTGYWNGKKEYRLCVHCHYPHSPRFKPLKPKPRPRRPSEIHYAESKN